MADHFRTIFVCLTACSYGFRLVRRLAPATPALLAIAACSQVPETKPSNHAKIDPVWGVEAPKKKVADGEPVPPGGGRYQVGKPYMVAGRFYFPHEDSNYDHVGMASWYGSDFHGRETANGEVYDKDSLSAAHTTLPIPSYARVTNLDNGRSIIVRINDRGPYVGDRLIDVSERTADLLAFKSKGLSHVRVQYIGPAPVEGSDQRMLVASLRGPGVPASIAQDRTLIARADKVPSDGRMAGLAANTAAPVPATSLQKPIVLASATEQDVVTGQPAARTTGYGPRTSLPPPRPQTAAIAQASQIPIAPPVNPQFAASRSSLPPNTLGTLSSRSLVASQPDVRPAVRQASAGTFATLQPLPPERPASQSPASSRPALSTSPAPGAIARRTVSPVVIPSRYGPDGKGVTGSQDPYRQSQGYMATDRASPAENAINRLIATDGALSRGKIDLGAYAKPENADRVAELMAAYGDVRSYAIRDGLGQTLTDIELKPASGMTAVDAMAAAASLGIANARLVD